MKKITVLLVALFCHCLTYADTPEKIVDSKIDSVTVYLDGAEISRKAKVSLPAGLSKVVLQKLSPQINKNNVQVYLGDNVSILSVTTQTNYLTAESQEGRIEVLKDSLADLNDAITLLDDEKNAYQEEKNMLLTNKSIGGTQTGVKVDDLVKAADLFRNRLMDINKRVSKINKEHEELRGTRSRIQKQLNEVNANYNQPYGEIVLIVRSETLLTVDVVFRYLVGRTGWAPAYNIKAKEIDQPIELTYRANVFNNTGIEWEDVAMKLSTANPLQGAAPPMLRVWHLGKDNQTDFSGYGLNMAANDILGKSQSAESNVVMKDGVPYVAIEAPELAVEFEIKAKQSIPADAKPYMIDVTSYTLNADFAHLAIPKLDRDAFLLAKVQGWEDLDLIEGPASVYYGNTYLGESYIHTRRVSDTLDLSLGRDKRVLVTRTKKMDYERKKILGPNIKESFIYEIAVKNNRKQPITIEIQDQIPIAADSDIKVEVEEISGAKLEELSGKLTWNLTLQPGESYKIKLAFFVKYPKDRSIVVSKSKVMYCPRF